MASISQILSIFLIVASCCIIFSTSTPIQSSRPTHHQRHHRLPVSDGLSKSKEDLKGELPFWCPDDVPGCYCSMTPWFEITCTGEIVTQETLQQYFLAIRQANDWISANMSLVIPYMSILNTSITALNFSAMDPGQSLELNILDIIGNRQLKSIVGSTHIDAFALYLDDNGFTDEDIVTGVSGIFEMSRGTVRTLSLEANSLQGHVTSTSQTILQYFYTMYPQLSALGLAGNNFETIQGGQFELFTNMGVLRLESNNIVELGENALNFVQPWPHPDGLRQIFMDDNKLTDAKVHPKAFTGVNGPTRLTLENNQFEFISAANFEALLQRPPENPGFTPSVEFAGNPFICDERMRWLHDQKETLEEVAEDVNCQNDPGFNVFTTSLYD